MTPSDRFTVIGKDVPMYRLARRSGELVLQMRHFELRGGVFSQDGGTGFSSQGSDGSTLIHVWRDLPTVDLTPQGQKP